MSSFQKFKDVTGYIVFGISPTSKEIDVSDSSSFEQDSTGAPVEKSSPLGYQASTLTVVYLIIQGVIGTGIFVTPASVLTSLGSIGATYIFWVVGFIITMFQICAYIEFVTYFSRRSGAEVVYLEQSYPRPKLMVPVVYAAVTVILSFATSSASAFATYIFHAAQYKPTPWEQRGLALLPLFLCFLIVSINTKFAMRLSSFLGFIKVIFIIFMIFSTFAVYGGHTKVGDTKKVFHNAWEGTTKDGNAISNAILKVVFSFGGSSYAFGVVAETAPHRTISAYKTYVPLTMFIIFIMYILVISGLYAGIGSVEGIKEAGNLISSIYFQKIFGEKGSIASSVFIALCAFGHLLGVFIAHSRSLRECGRQGVLPYPRLWTSVKPFGTPIFAAFITLLVNIVILLAPPPGDAYNFVVDLGSYQSYVFNLLLFIGLLRLRSIRKKRGLGYKEFHIWTPILVVSILWMCFVLIMAFVPPKGTLIGSDVSFFYAAYPLTTIGLIALCFGYYAIWAFVLPKVGGYKHRIESFELSTGEKGHTVIKVPLGDVAQWDEENGEVREVPVADEEFDSTNNSLQKDNVKETEREI